MRKHLLALFALLGAGFAQAGEPVVNVYTWPNYLPDQVVAAFTRETGIKVQITLMDSLGTLQSKLLAGRSGFDVVTPTLSYAGPQVKAGLFKPLDQARLPNYPHLDPQLIAKLDRADPTHRFVVPYLYGTDGLGVNWPKVKKALGGLPPPDNLWDLVFKPAYASKVAKCGISFLDSAPDVLGLALYYQGKDPFAGRSEDVAPARALLRQVRPFIRTFNTANYIDSLAQGEICVAFGYSGDIVTAAQMAREAKNQVEITYEIPKQGTVLWMDMLAIPNDAPHPDNALRLMNYLMHPDVSAAVSNGSNYPNASRDARKRLTGPVWRNPYVIPDATLLKRLLPVAAIPEKSQRMWSVAFDAVKRGS